MHENTVRLRDFKYIDQVTQDYGTGQIWRSSLGLWTWHFSPDWFPSKPSLTIKQHLLLEARGYCGYFPGSRTSPSALLAWLKFPERF